MPGEFMRVSKESAGKVTKIVTGKQTKNVSRKDSKPQMNPDKRGYEPAAPLGEFDLVVDQLFHRAAGEPRIPEQDEERWLALTEFIT